MYSHLHARPVPRATHRTVIHGRRVHPMGSQFRMISASNPSRGDQSPLIPLESPHNILFPATESKETSVLNFDDPTTAFQSKSNQELLRAWLVFKLCSFRPLVQHSEGLLALSRKIFGNTFTNWTVKKTFFAHFCAGESGDEIQPVLQKLRKYGIGGILDYAAENDVAPDKESKWDAQAPATPATTSSIPLAPNPAMSNHEVQVATQTEKRSEHRKDVISAHVYSYSGEEECDKNANIFLNCIEAVAPNPDSFAAIKITALGKPSLLERISVVLLAVRKLFGDFAHDGQVTFPQFSSKLEKLGVKLNDEEKKKLFERFDSDRKGTIDYINWTQTLQLQDLTTRALFTKERYDVESLARSGGLPLLDEVDTQLFDNMVKRVEKVAAAAAKAKVRLMIDAEQTYLQPAIDNFSLDLQRKYNKEFPSIFTTYQCYLTWSKQHLLNDLERSRREGWMFAGKLVRGAYMVLERKKAEEEKYTSPIWPKIEDTHKNYNECIELVMKEIHRSNLLIASHNQQSVETSIAYMNKNQIPRDRVFFGQLLGMADHLSFTLGQNGYGVFKYIPYGPVDEVMPYLIRRAQENTAMMKGADHEREMLGQEIKKRIFNFGR